METIRKLIENFRWLSRAGASLAWVCATGVAPAQGVTTHLNTGGGQPLVTEVRTFTIGADPSLQRFVFDWGFATDEVLSPGTLLDSFTITLQDEIQSLTGIYAVADASGTLLAPVTPGTILIDPSTVFLNTINYPSPVPALADRRAYSMIADIPAQFAGKKVNLFFDLFDNQNLVASQGWFSGPSLVIVPEPGVASLAILGGLVFCSLRRFLK